MLFSLRMSFAIFMTVTAQFLILNIIFTPDQLICLLLGISGIRKKIPAPSSRRSSL